MTKVLNNCLTVSQFEKPVALLNLLSDRYILKDMNIIILPKYRLGLIYAILLQGWLWHQITRED